jgi:hypothetical protein
MRSLKIAVLFAITASFQPSKAGFVLTDDYSKDAFFGNFTAYTGPDPTQGFVDYLDYEHAIARGLIGQVGNYNQAAYIGVDYENTTTTGRASMRITSPKSFNHGLFIADIAHMPGGLCGVWPAFWLVGPDWPTNGEIDIFEGVDAQQTNQMTLHTNAGCTIDNNFASSFSSQINSTNCDGDAPDQGKNEGCGIISRNPSSYGPGFNAAGGGVYATLWNSSAITIWFFPRPSIPTDLLLSSAATATPDPSTWGIPQAVFTGKGCDIDDHFKDMQIVFDTTFCGDWAGNVWSQFPECKAMATTCEEHVGQMPDYFRKAYWLVNSVRVYQEE